jgi:hypothetical protein
MKTSQSQNLRVLIASALIGLSGTAAAAGADDFLGAAGARQEDRQADRQADRQQDRIGSVVRIERAPQSEASHRPETAERVHRPERAEKAEKIEKVERPQRVERIQRPEKVEKVERPEKVEHGLIGHR